MLYNVVHCIAKRIFALKSADVGIGVSVNERRVCHI